MIMQRRFFLWIFLLILIYPKMFLFDETTIICQEILEGRSKCCGEYFWESSTNSCIKCQTGYFGVNCSEVCVLGHYGDECQNVCPIQCNDTCHHISGECLESTEDPYYHTDNLPSTYPPFIENLKKMTSKDRNHTQKSTKMKVLTAIISSGSVFIITLLIVLIIQVVRFFKHRKMIVNMRQINNFSLDGQTVPVYEQINESRMIRNMQSFEV